jgi:hypothetical protein
MKRIALILALLLVLSLGVGCSNTTQPTTAPAEETTTAESTSEPTTATPTTEQATTGATEQQTTETATEAVTETQASGNQTTAETSTESTTTTASQQTTKATEQQTTTATEATTEAQTDSGDNVFADVNPKAPIVVISYGQSSDGAMVKALLDKTGITHTYKQIIEPSELSGFNTIVIVPGASSKGLGAAGISPEEEIERVNKVNASITSSMKVIVVHIGGENRRGDLSDEMIDIALEKSDAIIVVESGDLDGKFSNFAKQNNVPIDSVPTINDTVGSFENLFE